MAKPVTVADIDAKVANGEITAETGAAAKLRLIGPQALTPAEAQMIGYAKPVNVPTPGDLVENANDKTGNGPNAKTATTAGIPNAPIGPGLGVGQPGKPMPKTGQVPYVDTLNAALAKNAYVEGAGGPMFPAAGKAAAADKRQALVGKRMEIVAQITTLNQALAAVESQLAQTGAV